MDNAPGSNKNSHVWGFLSNLVERGVFKRVFLSFFPVGHTHFGPDRCASRISVGVRWRTIHTLEEFHDLIARSATPAPRVEHITQVADWRALMNPSDNPQWTGARILPQRGIGSLRPCCVPELAIFVADTSSLHWKFSLDRAGKPVIQDKQISAVRDWSNVHYPWNGNFKEADGSSPPDGMSGITSSTLPTMLKVASNRPLASTRHTELKKYIAECSTRLDDASESYLEEWVERLATARAGSDCELHWEDGGLFKSELKDVEPEEDHDDELLWEFDGEEADDVEFASMQRDIERQRQEDSIPLGNQNSLLGSLGEQNALRQKSLAQAIHVNDFIVYKPFYLASVPADKRKPFYLARVLALNPPEGSVQVKTWITGSKGAGLLDTTQNVSYRPYNGGNSVQDVLVADVYHCFVNKTGTFKTLRAAMKRQIQAAIETRALAALDKNQSDQTFQNAVPRFRCAPGND